MVTRDTVLRLAKEIGFELDADGIDDDSMRLANAIAQHATAEAQKEIERLKEYEWMYKGLCK